MKAKARMFFTPDDNTFLSLDEPISYARNPAWMMIINGIVRESLNNLAIIA